MLLYNIADKVYDLFDFSIVCSLFVNVTMIFV